MKFIIIGGGIVGLGTALALLRNRPGARVQVLEKESGPGRHQSTHNSGVLHAGLYYKPGSLKARLAVNGIRQMKDFCRTHGVAFDECGKVVVATDEAEVVRLKELFQRGEANGLTGLRWLDAAGLREIEPHSAGIAAVQVPEEGIVDYRGVCEAMMNEIRTLGGEFTPDARVTAIHQKEHWTLETPVGEFTADFIINCAGLFCDRVAELAGVEREVHIVPFRGEYYELAPEAQHLVRNLIYPVPDPAFPFLGVHFTRLIHGGVEAGPNAVLAFAREGYSKKDISLGDMADVFAFPGLWNFLRKYPQMCWEEVIRSFSRRLFAQSLQKLVPEVAEKHLAPGGSGVRAQAMLRDGTLVQDFWIVQKPGALHLLNAPSPGATASLAIGEYLSSQLPIPA